MKRQRSPEEVLELFEVAPALYLIGSLERGLTVYNQQLRAHNLAWALGETHKKDQGLLRVAVVGGGIAGLTTTAGILSLLPQAYVTIFEKLWDLCPLQQGSDTRWLHPRIYDWPKPGSRAPGASLPLLNWSEGRASDVARTILRDFGDLCDELDSDHERLRVVLGLGHFRITAADKKVEWTGSVARRSGAFFSAEESRGESEDFDLIVLAAGFGLESSEDPYERHSYWRNEQLGQPLLDGNVLSYVVSGYGDGALTDLCRLTIERYRQDTILYELFRENLEALEERLWGRWERHQQENAYEIFEEFRGEFEGPRKRLSERLRKDTRVALNIRGKDGGTRAFREIFEPGSSFLNRLMTYLLFRCGAYSISFEPLATAAEHQAAPAENVLCRHGAKPMEHLSSIFTDKDEISDRLATLRVDPQQLAERMWVPGSFPQLTRGWSG